MILFETARRRAGSEIGPGTKTTADAGRPEGGNSAAGLGARPRVTISLPGNRRVGHVILGLDRLTSDEPGALDYRPSPNDGTPI